MLRLLEIAGLVLAGYAALRVVALFNYATALPFS